MIIASEAMIWTDSVTEDNAIVVCGRKHWSLEITLLNNELGKQLTVHWMKKKHFFQTSKLEIDELRCISREEKLTQGHVMVNIWYTTNTPVGFNAFNLYGEGGAFFCLLCAGLMVYLLCKVEIYLSTLTPHFILSLYDVICDRWVDRYISCLLRNLILARGNLFENN